MYPAFNPYGMMQMPYQPPRPALPQQQVTQVSGPESLPQIQMAPNSSGIVIHQTEPIMYLGVTDGVGKATWTAYDYTPHKDKAQAQQESMDARLAAVEAAVKRLEGRYDTDHADAS